MKPGTPGFVGARLREAREARGITVISLADRLGITRAAIYQYERDEQTPRPEVMDDISNTLGLSLAYFRKPAHRLSLDGNIFYRSKSTSTKGARAKAEKRYFWLQEIVDYLRQFVQFPKVNIPDFNLDPNPLLLSPDQIEDLAIKTRRHWGLGDGPIANMVGLLESNGVIVARDRLDAEALDAFSEFYLEDETPYIVLGSEKLGLTKSSVRSRYDAAHELGHLVLHKHADKKQLAKLEIHNEVERQAHRFSGAFLFPAQAFGREFCSSSLDALRFLKPKWKVSIAMMIKRAENLGHITSQQYTSLYINMSQRRWRTVEPYDDKIAVEDPRLLTRAFELILSNGLQTKDDILSALVFPPPDIEQLANLSGQLTNLHNNEDLLKLIKFPSPQ